jgi:hypothetical protein
MARTILPDGTVVKNPRGGKPFLPQGSGTAVHGPGTVVGGGPGIKGPAAAALRTQPGRKAVDRDQYK